MKLANIKEIGSKFSNIERKRKEPIPKDETNRLSWEEMIQQIPGHVLAILEKLDITPEQFIKTLGFDLEDLRTRRQDVVTFGTELTNFFNYLKNNEEDSDDGEDMGDTDDGNDTLFDILEQIISTDNKLSSLWRMFRGYREETLNKPQ